MRVKRFVVDSMPDALQKIRSDLGRDAVILNTKEIRTGGILGLFSRKQIEVIAATEDNVRERTNASVSPKTPQPAPTAPATPAATQVTSAVAVAEKEETPRPDHHLTEEIQQMKKMMFKLFEQSNGQDSAVGPFSKLEERLKEHEFDTELIQDMLHYMIDEADEPLQQLSEEDMREHAKAYLKRLIPAENIKGIAEGTKIVHIVGPTGVGKTTTIAKLAAEKVLKQHKKVGFITSDTYRIAAVEQLKTYATILNIPLEVVASPQDLPRALEVLKDCDIIFMDTAGRNFRNPMYVSELNSLLRTYENSETILTLSLTMKYKDMQAVTHNFSQFHLDKILFTKKDETNTYGSIFNIAKEFSLPLSYITNGQNVPDDISTVNIDELIAQILEE